MERYFRLINKNRMFKREVLLLESPPCSWGKCSFCSFNGGDFSYKKQLSINAHTVLKLRGDLDYIEVCNSGSWMELPESTQIILIYSLLEFKKPLMTEARWMWREEIKNLRYRLNNEIEGKDCIIKIGIETWDNDFRTKVLNKPLGNITPSVVREYTDSICLLIGVEGQTKDQIKQDIDLSISQFKYVFVNSYHPGLYIKTKVDKKLIDWAHEKFSWLHTEKNCEFNEKLDF